ncbi:glycoside hydrolase family 99-like domain-containing protein [Persicobacter diffluens]|uniref:Uncharacterized protein n=1 Tax=Persicobacter diffluens TaxID=981 RepID=A0AAN4W1I7_9BACT|nr:hypothetical protein PEDI_46160 [Persicobacter diffluens]
MKYINSIFIAFLSFLLFSCVQDVPTADDHFLNYEIPNTPPEFDYVVGAHYQQFSWASGVKEVPSLGYYNSVDPAVFKQHVSWANDGGIDYFLLNLRSAAIPSAFKADSTTIERLMEAENSMEINFALNYNFSGLGLSDANRIEDVDMAVETFIKDFEKMTYFFDKENYQKLDGKVVVYVSGAHELFAHDNITLIQQLRETLANFGEGYELYLIGEQWQWTPPLRYHFRFQDAFDAVTHTSYVLVDQASYDRYVMFHQYTDQALIYSQQALNEINLDYIPQFSPSFTGKILNPTSKTYDFPKDEQWFITNCNIAKRSAPGNRMVILDSFNNWNSDKQIEPAQSYGDKYLKILREQFKVN